MSLTRDVIWVVHLGSQPFSLHRQTPPLQVQAIWNDTWQWNGRKDTQSPEHRDQAGLGVEWQCHPLFINGLITFHRHPTRGIQGYNNIFSSSSALYTEMDKKRDKSHTPAVEV